MIFWKNQGKRNLNTFWGHQGGWPSNGTIKRDKSNRSTVRFVWLADFDFGHRKAVILSLVLTDKSVKYNATNQSFSLTYILKLLLELHVALSSCSLYF